MNSTTSLLEIKQLSVEFNSQTGKREVLHNVSLELHKEEILGIVGESGSGKSLTSLSILDLLPKNAKITSGEILFRGEPLLAYTPKQFRKLRGAQISMIFQEPMSSLNPSMKCGEQVLETLKVHTEQPYKTRKKSVIQLFKRVQLPRPKAIFDSYPHEISGGQKQRVMIAMAIACKPKILIADEPTTALDVTVQKEILKLLKGLQEETGMSIIFISHDLALVSEIANRVAVMYKGKIVEEATTLQIFHHPKEQYTKALIASKPNHKIRLKHLPTINDFISGKKSHQVITPKERKKRQTEIYAQPPLLKVINVEKEFISNPGWFKKQRRVKAVNKVSFELFAGETLGLVGESGCGKSTLSSVILQLQKATSGKILYRGKDLTTLTPKEIRKLRKEIQLIFQDPFSSLNPRISVGNAIVEPMKVFGLYKNQKARKLKAMELLEQVGLNSTHFYRYPHEFSGGQRQRIGIARAIGIQPKLIICDESVSALDISVQAQVLNLLNRLKEEFNFTYIFISHDLSVVRYMADQLLVMKEGEIVERGEADELYEHPQNPYTQKLIAAIPKGI